MIAALAKGLPTYWLGELGRAPVTDEAAPAVVGIAVVAAWTAAFAAFAAWRFRRADLSGLDQVLLVLQVPVVEDRSVPS